MSLQHFRQANWLGNALGVLMLCFALGTLANAGHTHELSQRHATHYNCDYCTSFGGMMDAPVAVFALAPHTFADNIIATPARRIIPARPLSVAQPRAPPAR